MYILFYFLSLFLSLSFSVSDVRHWRRQQWIQPGGGGSRCRTRGWRLTRRGWRRSRRRRPDLGRRRRHYLPAGLPVLPLRQQGAPGNRGCRDHHRLTIRDPTSQFFLCRFVQPCSYYHATINQLPFQLPPALSLFYPYVLILTTFKQFFKDFQL